MNAESLTTLTFSEGDLSPDAFVEWMRREAQSRYHDRHPFHVRMHRGELSRREIQLWVLNRYYYQTRLPIKDALIVSKSNDPDFRRQWLLRVIDENGALEGEGGLALWQRLGVAVGLSEAELIAHAGVHPGVSFACNEYVNFVTGSTLIEAVASSLTECFEPELLSTRLAAFERYYRWIDDDALEYFRIRVPRAQEDAAHALGFVVENALTFDDQRRCVEALVRKTEILWHLLDCVEQQAARELMVQRAHAVA
jgi:pyrroloquinoline-quinone synthase